MKKKKMKPLKKAVQSARYHPVFSDIDAQSAEIIETVLCVVREYGLDVHTWMTEYNKACASNGGMPPAQHGEPRLCFSIGFDIEKVR